MADPKQQPDFNTVADTMNDISRSYATLAIQFDKMRNFPVLDHGAQILAQLANIAERLGNIERRLDDFELRSDAGWVNPLADVQRLTMNIRDYNSVARLANSSPAAMADSQLVPLRTRWNEEVDRFPMTQEDIDRLHCESLSEQFGYSFAG